MRSFFPPFLTAERGNPLGTEAAPDKFDTDCMIAQCTVTRRVPGDGFLDPLMRRNRALTRGFGRRWESWTGLYGTGNRIHLTSSLPFHLVLFGYPRHDIPTPSRLHVRTRNYLTNHNSVNLEKYLGIIIGSIRISKRRSRLGTLLVDLPVHRLFWEDDCVGTERRGISLPPFLI